MGEVVSLAAVRNRRAAEEHVRALLLFECASTLARREDPELLALVTRRFGPDWFEARVAASLSNRAESAEVPAPRAARSSRREGSRS